ncbi:MAG: hypothetical protein QME27_03200, partial [Syntrophaceae bacterium]|nr:hypothetical protein [Syntrophaceae bacterium]
PPGTVFQGVQMALNREGADSTLHDGAALYQSSFRDDGTMRYEPIDGGGDRFLLWLASFTHAKATIGQALWNRWLDIADFASLVGDEESEGQRIDIVADFQNACRSYTEIYTRGIKACRTILVEFSKRNPDSGSIRKLADQLSRGEAEIRDLEGPLPILKEMHELCMSETEVCNFPKLAREFLKTYETMSGTIRSFEETLREITPAPARS